MTKKQTEVRNAALAAYNDAIEAAVRKRGGRWATADDNCKEEKHLAQIEFIEACDAAKKACKAEREAALKKEGKRGK